MTVPVRLIILGAGSRGAIYGAWARAHPEAATIVAVAEPRALYRETLAREHGLAACRRFQSTRPNTASGNNTRTEQHPHRG